MSNEKKKDQFFSSCLDRPSVSLSDVFVVYSREKDRGLSRLVEYFRTN